MKERLDERAEESAAEVLARLERYVATLHARQPVPADTLIPARDVVAARAAIEPRHRRFVAEVAPALIAVTICSFVILLSEWFDISVAVFVGAGLLLVGVVGLVRRVPLARAYTFGLVVAALLLRLS